MNKTPAAILALFDPYPLERFASGTVILAANEEPRGIYLLVKGLVRQYDIADNGSEIVTNVYKPGSYFPISWAIGKFDNQWFFEAQGSVEIKVAPASAVKTLLKTDVEVTYEILYRLCKGALGQQRRMAHLMGGSAYTRVAYEIITQCLRFGKSTKSGVSIGISEAELASLSGLTRETVSRALSELVEQGHIVKTRAKITVSNLDILTEELGDRL